MYLLYSYFSFELNDSTVLKYLPYLIHFMFHTDLYADKGLMTAYREGVDA